MNLEGGTLTPNTTTLAPTTESQEQRVLCFQCITSALSNMKEDGIMHVYFP